MPIYEYECGGCGLKGEIHQSIEQRDEQVMCVNCKRAMKRNVAAGVGAIFKGSGWGKQ